MVCRGHSCSHEHLFAAVEDHSNPCSPHPPTVCLVPVGLYSVAPELSPPPGSQRGGPLTVKATEAGSRLIGSCVSSTETCQSQHFSSCFPCRPLLLLFFISRSGRHRYGWQDSRKTRWMFAPGFEYSHGATHLNCCKNKKQKCRL